MLGSASLFAWYEWQEIKDLQQQCAKQAEHIQENEQNLILIESWVKEDGYNSTSQWWEDYQKYQVDYSHCDEKVINGENSVYVTEEQKNRLQEIAAEIKKLRSIAEIKLLIEEFDIIVEDIDRQKDISISQEKVSVIDDNLIIDYTPNNSFIASNENYAVPSSGLTQQSGVNYYGGRTETYYSSNVLYHYRTPEWTVDEEGFYRTNEGYYVVAASDMNQGTTFEGSKGTCIVLDSGCSAGTTDYYVAWS